MQKMAPQTITQLKLSAANVGHIERSANCTGLVELRSRFKSFPASVDVESLGQ